MTVNKVFLIGRLTADPEFRETSSSAVTNFTLALHDKWKDKSGKPMERTEFVKVVVWGKQAAACSDFLRKGRQAHVEGSLHTRKYQDQSGAERTVTEVKAENVVFLGGAGSD